MTETNIWEMGENDLAGMIVGRTVTSVDEQNKKIILDDGTILEFVDAGDCCAYFNAGLRSGRLTSNAVTGVTREERDGDSPEAWTIHILAADTRIASVDIDGDSTSGYYCHSISLSVTRPDGDSA